MRQRTHDIANTAQALDGKITLAVKDRDHALQRMRTELERYQEECMTKAEAQSLAKATVAEMKAGGERRLSTWLVFLGVVVASTVGPTVVAIVMHFMEGR